MLGRMAGDNQIGILPLSEASPETSSLVIEAEFKAGIISENNSTQVSDLMCPIPLQAGLSVCNGQW